VVVAVRCVQFFLLRWQKLLFNKIILENKGGTF
jgi:hypothetical protein